MLNLLPQLLVIRKADMLLYCLQEILLVGVHDGVQEFHHVIFCLIPNPTESPVPQADDYQGQQVIVFLCRVAFPIVPGIGHLNE